MLKRAKELLDEIKECEDYDQVRGALSAASSDIANAQDLVDDAESDCEDKENEEDEDEEGDEEKDDEADEDFDIRV